MAENSQDAAKAFDAYEIIGVITPGAVAAILLATEWPVFRALLGERGLSVGDFGLFVIVAFVMGHLIQALGNALEYLVWMPRGMPTNWVRNPTQRLVTAAQRATLQAKVSEMEGAATDISKLDRVTWRAITTRAFGRVKAGGLSARIDNSNRTYGMFRGLAAGILAALAWYLLNHSDEPRAIVLIVIAFVAALYRMRRTGEHYARALILDFIDLDPAKPSRR